ncbi:MAG: hypothetical protein GF331_13245 [Chitinivibrionales bacterium]|nr:hypothetical protein [Chitinivibrionales bacterium]
MDPETSENRERWNRLADAGIMFSKPFMDFTPADAERHVSKQSVPLFSEIRGVVGGLHKLYCGTASAQAYFVCWLARGSITGCVREGQFNYGIRGDIIVRCGVNKVEAVLGSPSRHALDRLISVRVTRVVNATIYAVFPTVTVDML